MYGPFRCEPNAYQISEVCFANHLIGLKYVFHLQNKSLLHFSGLRAINFEVDRKLL